MYWRVREARRLTVTLVPTPVSKDPLYCKQTKKKKVWGGGLRAELLEDKGCMAEGV
jgi:hypothetical protein